MTMYFPRAAPIAPRSELPYTFDATSITRAPAAAATHAPTVLASFWHGMTNDTSSLSYAPAFSSRLYREARFPASRRHRAPALLPLDPPAHYHSSMTTTPHSPHT